MKQRAAEIGLVYCAAVWGAAFYLVKAALAGVDAEALVAYRFLLSAALILPWVLRKKNIFAPWRQAAGLAALLVILYLSQTLGLQYTSASNSGFITGLFVLFVPIFLFLFFRKSPQPWQWAAAVLAAAGLWRLTGGVTEFNKGDSWTLLAAMTYAGHLLATDHCVKAEGDLALLAFHQFWMTGLAALALGVATGRPLTVKTPAAASVILFLAAVPTLSAFYIQLAAQKSTSPLKVSLIFSLEPVFAGLFAWTLGGEVFIAGRALGGGMIVAAMILSDLDRVLPRKVIIQ